MTLTITAMIGDYALIAADRKRNYVYDRNKEQMVLTPLTKKESRILIVNNVVLVGSCNVSILKKYNKYFSKIAKNNPNDLTNCDEHLKAFCEISDLDRVNYFLMFRTTSNQLYHTLYCQTDDVSHQSFTDKMTKGHVDNFCVTPPFDIDGQEVYDRLNYLLSIMPDKTLTSIIHVLKQLYTECSDISPFVNSGFHLAVLHKNTPDFFEFIDN